ncbi:hypothetical protein HGRIS_006252 [Hohenbuehelia grisea]|uniref:Transmembrane protein n=1 Tax=Hohenbuehelia grisea TaxID=104357 RepID=A0ABR3K1Z9_9AGAR
MVAILYRPINLRMLSKTYPANKKVLWDRAVVFVFCCCFLLFSRALTGTGDIEGHASVRCPLLDLKKPYQPQALLHDKTISKPAARGVRTSLDGAHDDESRRQALRRNRGMADRRRMLGRALTMEKGPLDDDTVETPAVSENAPLSAADVEAPSVQNPVADAPSSPASDSPLPDATLEFTAPVDAEPSIDASASSPSDDSDAASSSASSAPVAESDEIPLHVEIPDDATDGLQVPVGEAPTSPFSADSDDAPQSQEDSTEKVEETA